MNYTIYGDFIKLGDLLKDLEFISSGGQAKYYLPENPVQVDGEIEIRRGRKIYPNMILIIEDNTIQTIAPSKEKLTAYQQELAEKKRIQQIVKQMNQKTVKKPNSTKRKPKFPGQK